MATDGEDVGMSHEASAFEMLEKDFQEVRLY